MTAFAFSLTAQHSLENPWLPNETGIRRRAGIVQALKGNSDMKLVALGGYPNHLGFSYAIREMAALYEIEPELVLDRLILVSGKANRTSEDIFHAVVALHHYFPHDPAETMVCACSHPYHLLRIANPIKTLGYEFVMIASGESGSPYSEDGSRERAIAQGQIDDLSTMFGLGQSSQDWKAAAQREADQAAQFSREWAAANPALEREMEMKLRTFARLLLERNILVQ